MAELHDFGRVFNGEYAAGRCAIGDVAMWTEKYDDYGSLTDRLNFAVCRPKITDGVIIHKWEYSTTLSWFIDDLDLRDNNASRIVLEEKLKNWQYSVSMSGRIICHERPEVEEIRLSELKVEVALLGIF